ncbi:MAG: transglycosylase SLT domain-containing protein [Anaerolineae bacterium]
MKRLPHHHPLWLYSLICLFLGSVLLACQSVSPEAAAAPSTPTNPTAAEVAASGEVTSQPAETSEANITATQGPPTATLEPTPTSTPTVIPPASLAEGIPMALKAHEDGAYGQAIGLWQAMLEDAPEEHLGELMVGLARTYRASGELHEAVAVLADGLNRQVLGDLTGEALGLLAVSYEDAGEWQSAIGAYEGYLEAEPSLAPEVRWHMAKAHLALGEYAAAQAQIEAIDVSSLDASRRAEVLEELAALRLYQDDYEGALAAYDQILAFAKLPDYRALVAQKRGAALLATGNVEEGLQAMAQVVRDRPQAYAAYLALQALDDAGVAAVGNLDRAWVLYYAGQHAGSLAVLDQNAVASEASAAASAHLLAGMNHEALDAYDAAIASYDRVITEHAEHALAGDAWLAKARTIRSGGGDPVGIYSEFQRLHPTHTGAPEALWLAASFLERNKDWKRAAEFYRQLRTTYPQDARTDEALFREALAAYASGDAVSAQSLFGEALRDGLPAAERARIQTWLGLAARANLEDEAAREHWEQAAASAPWDYYGLRARDLLAGRPLRLEPGIGLAEVKLGPTEDDWKDVAEWIKRLEQPPAEERIEVAEHPLAHKGVALWRLGWREESLAAFRSLRDLVRNDPAALVDLARLSNDLGSHAITISCAERLVALGAGAKAPPHALEELAYPTFYGDLVVAEAEREDIDPLLFLALIRQESRFFASAVSYAWATGLTQVMPATGEWIAAQIGDSGFQVAWLNRPVLGVRYGVWYLAEALRANQNDWIASLVAYNAGPGNLARWTGGEPISDFDLFYETVPVTQTKDYIRLIYENYCIYERIYRAD